ncbi:DUF3987 domain-containing protein [Massilia sp. CCM 8695]|uniref:DUF3987 domain-containing protein n=2 Tax=Massilia frigida TaxID=2609281 RepID=A0ABX0N556_9BURK|nr:DUF3987 domain-containing protein [Massilia frigida]
MGVLRGWANPSGAHQRSPRMARCRLAARTSGRECQMTAACDADLAHAVEIPVMPVPAAESRANIPSTPDAVRAPLVSAKAVAVDDSCGSDPATAANLEPMPTLIAEPVAGASEVSVPKMNPAANPAFDFAMKFAARGVAVFPLFGFDGKNCSCGKPTGSPNCTPGKHPRQLASFRGASINTATITSWFTYYGPVNYGIATGREIGTSGKMVVVVDIDAYKLEAAHTLDELERAGYFFPETAEVLTGGGGRHLYYVADAGSQFDKTLGPGIDMKGIGGYVVGPGSMHASGSRYEWEASSDLFEGQEIAPLPNWIYEKFGKKPAGVTPATRSDSPMARPAADVSEEEMAEYRADLEHISPENYSTWCTVLMALKNRSNSDQMFELADRWSKKAGYKDVGDVRKKWEHVSADGGVTITSLKRLAGHERTKGTDLSMIMDEPRRAPEVFAAPEWAEPEQIAAYAPAIDYPLDALPTIMQDAVIEVQDFTRAPMALVACSALASLSVAAQGLYDVQRDVGLNGPVSLYIIAIAESGERKSTLDNFFIKPARDFEDACAIAAKPERLKFETDVQAWDAKNKGILEKIVQQAKETKDTSTKEAELAAHQAAKPVAPVIPRVIYGDTTPEALTRGLAFEWPSGGVISSEGGAVFGGHGMGKDSQMRNMAVFNELWDGKPIRIDRRTSESYTVKGVRLTVAVQVQPATLSTFMNGSGSLARGTGYIARFLVTYPESTQGTRAYKKAPLHWPSLDRFRDRLEEVLAIMPVIEEGALKLSMLSLSEGAMAAWIDFYNQIEVQLGKGGALCDVRDVASKTADNAVRIAALFHVLTNSQGPISEMHIRGAARLAEWHLHESQRVFGGVMLSAGTSDAQKLDEWLIRRCNENGMTELPMRFINQYGPTAFRKKSALVPVLAELERLGRVKVGGEPARTIRVNPALLN